MFYTHIKKEYNSFTKKLFGRYLSQIIEIMCYFQETANGVTGLIGPTELFWVTVFLILLPTLLLQHARKQTKHGQEFAVTISMEKDKSAQVHNILPKIWFINQSTFYEKSSILSGSQKKIW